VRAISAQRSIIQAIEATSSSSSKQRSHCSAIWLKWLTPKQYKHTGQLRVLRRNSIHDNFVQVVHPEGGASVYFCVTTKTLDFRKSTAKVILSISLL